MIRSVTTQFSTANPPNWHVLRRPKSYRTVFLAGNAFGDGKFPVFALFAASSNQGLAFVRCDQPMFPPKVLRGQGSLGRLLLPLIEPHEIAAICQISTDAGYTPAVV